ncbi:MAG: DegT/DnrJ/EryC1/StrS family aminotransferase, partial [Cyanobacteria bacterium REEB65]|nr:DegT/DnrJ/EryC1/StrS family aminotransferase [Cyanobacteria bacterium REEB65]
VDYVTDAVKSGWVSSLGTYLDRFELAFAEFCGTRYAIATSNGTTGLHLALTALGIGIGDEVVIPDLTFIATANAVRYCGATVKIVDIEEPSLGMDPAQFEAAIGPRTRAVIPVHLYGHPADMREINRIAAKHGVAVVEDAAEAHGADLEGRRVGSLGRCGVFSFYGNKILTSGEGGMITTDDEALNQRARYLRDHAMSKAKRYWHDEIGFNYRMTNLQAALGCAQLERMPSLMAKRRDIFAAYQEGLADLPGIRLNSTAQGATNAYWMVCLELMEAASHERDRLMEGLRAHRVDSRPYFYPLSDMPTNRQDPDLTPIAHQVAARGLCLPTFTNLERADISYICDVVRDQLAKLPSRV